MKILWTSLMDAPLGRKGVQLSKRGGNTCFVDALDGDPVTYCTYRVDIQYICMIGITGLAKSPMYYRGLPTGGWKQLHSFSCGCGVHKTRGKYFLQPMENHQ